ncbi:helix-turn-helix transcriptional regulator [Ottowia thiooxydans]|uniref:helix-turn-helix transcriptional regulator n=1 Tax=Ottowia thiooxydans TaxID=219182 RepID=UPI00040BFE59|nr:helix-turn-helix transcriptional regulator [Ottowia thiooxydans]
MSSSSAAPPLLERRGQANRLEELLDRSSSGQACFVSLVAEAGAGKSRLLEALQSSRGENVVFMIGRAFQATSTTPYSVWVDALEPYLRQLSRRELLHLLGNCSDLPRLFPSCSHLQVDLPSLPSGDMGLEQTRVFGQIGSMLARMSRDRLVVVALDNLQWADASSIELLHSVVRASTDAKLLIIGLLRDDDLLIESPLSTCLRSLGQLGLEERLTIPPLSLEATSEILAEETGQQWPREDVINLHRLTQGNALFVHEFGRHAAAKKKSAPLSQISFEDLPSSVQALLSERLRELDEDSRRVLAFASAFEAPISYELLQALTAYSEERLLDALDRLCFLRFLTEAVHESSTQYEFHKPLVQATVYRSMGIARRQFLHRLIAEEAIRSGRLDSATIARHLIAGARTNDSTAALPYLIQASQDAVRSFGNHEAVSLLKNALKLMIWDEQTKVQRAQLLLMLGESHKRLGHFDDAVGAWTEALPSATSCLSATLHRSIARTHWQAGRESAAIVTIENGIACLADAEFTEEAAFLRQEYALALARQGRLREARIEAALALSLCDEERHPEVVARIYIVMGLIRGYAGDLRAAMQSVNKAINLCEDLAYPGAAFLAHYTLAGLLRYEGDFSVFEQQCEACMKIADRMHSVALASWPLSMCVERYTLEGRIREAIEKGERALSLDRSTSQGAVLPRTHSFLAIAYRLSGDVAKAKAHLKESSQLVSSLDKRELRVVAVHTYCQAYVEFLEGNFELCLSLIDSLTSSRAGEGAIAFYALHPYSLPLAAEAAARLGRIETANELLQQLYDLRRSGTSSCEGSIMLVMALLKAAASDYRGACTEIQKAITVWESKTRPFETARARVELAGWLENQEKLEQAVDQLNAAGMVYTRIGASREAASVAQKLRKLGRRPLFGQQRHSSGQPISQREEEVVSLVALGKSNKEIAAALFLSELTVETHMKNILRKLSLKSRAQVATYAATQHSAGNLAGARVLSFEAAQIRRA